jgi:hypothetical protein
VKNQSPGIASYPLKKSKPAMLKLRGPRGISREILKMPEKSEICKKQVSNKKCKYFSVYPEFHAGRHDATYSAQITNQLSTPVLRPSFVASSLENPQSKTHEVKDPNQKQRNPTTNSSHPLLKNAAH